MNEVTNYISDNHTKRQVNNIMNNKDVVGSIAEKARKNLSLLYAETNNKAPRMHYFTVGHTFKHIDGKSFFNSQYDEDYKTEKPTRYQTLQRDRFPSPDVFNVLIKKIRNQYSHYAHDFASLNTDAIDPHLIAFLEESFDFAVVQAYLYEQGMSHADFIQKNNSDEALVNFLALKFYPADQKQQNNFKKRSKKQALQNLLYIEVSEPFPYTVDRHELFNIQQGRYLSFYACLFLLSLFLYKDEAETLISKIKGFKRNDYTVKQSKRFITYAKYHIWNKKYGGKTLEKEFLKIPFSEQEVQDFNYEMNTAPEIKNDRAQLKVLKEKEEKCHTEKEKRKNKQDIKKITDKIKKAERERLPNPIKETLEKRVKDYLLLRSYGRNQDRFIHFTILFLATQQYFSTETQFKIYRFYDPEEEKAFLDDLKDMVRTQQCHKKELDNLSFHQGKLTHFCTYSEHQKKYPAWDTAFVIENNAVQLKMALDASGMRTVSLQRALLLYLLNDALYGHPDGSCKNEGKALLKAYTSYLEPAFEAGKKILTETSTITAHEKTALKKLFPKRLLHQYAPANYEQAGPENKPPTQALALFLEKTKAKEAAYATLRHHAKNKVEFEKKNKGTRFKMEFIRKAWHLMYFKAVYKEQQAISGHHKQFHITKDEFHDFSKWLYAFDEYSPYKNLLRDLLLRKGFLEHPQFKTLF